MKRPFNFTVLSVFLVFLSFVGLGNSMIIFSGEFPEIPSIAGVLAILYGFAAAISAIGIWRLKPWSRHALRICIVAYIIFTVVSAVYFVTPILGRNFWVPAILIFVVFLLYLLDRYVGRTLEKLA